MRYVNIIYILSPTIVELNKGAPHASSPTTALTETHISTPIWTKSSAKVTQVDATFFIPVANSSDFEIAEIQITV